MRRLNRFFTAVGGIVVSASLLLGLSAAPANASERHFVLIVAKGSPNWSADAQLYAQGGGKPAYTWKRNYRTGGRELWSFTWNGDGGWIDVKIKGVTSVGTVSRPYTHLKLDRDHCFVVDALGEPRYAGDSKTRGCNSK